MDVIFNSLLGPVTQSEILASLMLMLKGMVGIFVVMLLIYLVIILLNKLPVKNKTNDNNSQVKN